MTLHIVTLSVIVIIEFQNSRLKTEMKINSCSIHCHVDCIYYCKYFVIDYIKQCILSLKLKKMDTCGRQCTRISN